MTIPVGHFKMTAVNSSGGSQSEPPDAGNHLAVLAAIVDLGKQNDDFKGRKSDLQKVYLAWEIVGEVKSDGSPFVIGQEYTFSPEIGGKSNIRKMIEAWWAVSLAEKQEIDLVSLLGKPAMLNVIHEKSKSDPSKEYAKIAGISKPMKGTQVPTPFHEPYVYALTKESPVPDIPEWLPFSYGKPLAEKVAEALNHQEWNTGSPSNGSPSNVQVVDDDIPF